MKDPARVQCDNAAADYVLDEIHALVQRGSAIVREDLGGSLHWFLPKEVQLMESGWYCEAEYPAGHRCSPDEVLPLYIDHVKHNLQTEPATGGQNPSL